MMKIRLIVIPICYTFSLRNNLERRHIGHACTMYLSMLNLCTFDCINMHDPPIHIIPVRYHSSISIELEWNTLTIFKLCIEGSNMNQSYFGSFRFHLKDLHLIWGHHSYCVILAIICHTCFLLKAIVARWELYI